jgi:hypothetical protein
LAEVAQYGSLIGRRHLECQSLGGEWRVLAGIQLYNFIEWKFAKIILFLSAFISNSASPNHIFESERSWAMRATYFPTSGPTSLSFTAFGSFFSGMKLFFLANSFRVFWVLQEQLSKTANTRSHRIKAAQFEN